MRYTIGMDDEAVGREVWRDAHGLLEMTLDAIEARDPSWQARHAELVAVVVPLVRPPAQRWKQPGTGFARDAHHLIDMALRQDREGLAAKMDLLGKQLAAKFAHQDELLAKLEPLRIAVRAFASRHGGRLDPDTSDPLAALRDALIQFDPRRAKLMLRELTRPDKYMFQHVVTSDDPTIRALAAYFDGPAFALWPLDDPKAVSGSVAAGHPERDTWWRSDDG
jgi:hypothetical protein